MYAQSVYSNLDQSISPLSCGDEWNDEIRVKQSGACGVASPKLIRSVVDTAGLGRFVYLEGHSGKRYVFSPIRPEQVALYDNALFAATEAGGASVRIGDDFETVRTAGNLFYVHLMDSDEKNALADLS